MKTVTTVTNRKATIRPMFVERKPPLPEYHRGWLEIRTPHDKDTSHDLST